MRAREYLNQVAELNKEINNKMVLLAHLNGKKLGVSSPAITERVQTSGNKNDSVNQLCEAEDLNREINSDVDRLYDLKKEILKFCIPLDSMEYDFVAKHYIDLKSTNDIAYMYRKTDSWAYKLRTRVLDSVQKLLDERDLSTNVNSNEI